LGDPVEEERIREETKSKKHFGSQIKTNFSEIP